MIQHCPADDLASMFDELREVDSNAQDIPDCFVGTAPDKPERYVVIYAHGGPANRTHDGLVWEQCAITIVNRDLTYGAGAAIANTLRVALQSWREPVELNGSVYMGIANMESARFMGNDAKNRFEFSFSFVLFRRAVPDDDSTA